MMIVLKNKKEIFNPVILLGLGFFAVGGILSGILAAKYNTEAYEIIKEAAFFSDNFRETLINGFLTGLLWTAMCIVGGMNVFLVPLIIVAVFVKGYSYGFTTGCIAASMGIYGYNIILAGLFIHNFLSILLLVFYGTFGINKSIGCYLNRRNYEYIHRKNKVYIPASFAVIVLTLVISVVEAAVSLFLYEI